MPYRNPRIGPLMDGLLKAPSDATARPTAKESGVKGALRAALRKLSEWDGKAGRDLAARMPEGTTLANATIPDYIEGPKGAIGALKRAAPFDAAHALAMGKVRAAESVPHEMPDLLPALAREGAEMPKIAVPAPSGGRQYFRIGDAVEDAPKMGSSLPQPPPEPSLPPEMESFVSYLNAPRKARAMAALNETMMQGGKVMTRKAIVDKMIAEGATVVAHPKDVLRLMKPDGSYVEQRRLTKTAMDYATHLLSIKQSP